jgi:hypothetical protein
VPAGPFQDLELIRADAGMSTTRFCTLIDMPERTWHRWQAKPRSAEGKVDPETGELLPVVTIVNDNGGSFRSFRFETFIELAHVRTRVRTPGQNGSRERGFGTLKYERLYLDEIDDAVRLAKHAEDYRVEYNTIRPHEATAWNRPLQVHLGLASPTVPTFHTESSARFLTRDSVAHAPRCARTAATGLTYPHPPPHVTTGDQKWKRRPDQPAKHAEAEGNPDARPGNDHINSRGGSVLSMARALPTGP